MIEIDDVSVRFGGVHALTGVSLTVRRLRCHRPQRRREDHPLRRGHRLDDPAVLLLDEPTSGLDADQSALFAAAVASLDATVLLVEHDVGFVMTSCDRVIVLDLGEVIADGPPDDIRQNQKVRTAYLG